jgi:phosphoglycerate dehydrogenase-like enzyme
MVQLDKKKVVLYGAGQLGVEVAHRLKPVNVSIALWVDQGSHNSMSEFDTCIGLPIEIPTVEFDFVILCSDIYREEMLDNCISMGIPINKIIHL